MVSASTGLISSAAKGWGVSGVSVDGAGRVFIADTLDQVISMASSGTQINIGGNGTAGYTGDGGPATSAEVNWPNGVWVDAVGNIYVGDTKNNVIRKITVSLEPAVATPVITPNGGIVSTAQTVTISDSTPGAVIYYTTDGTTPTTASIPYDGAFPVPIPAPQYAESLSTVQAIAVAPGHLVSPVASAAFTYTNLPVEPPVFSLLSGTYTNTLSVLITDPVVGAAIYYTTDGSTPSASSTPYTGPISVPSSETIKAIAYTTLNPPSAVVAASYVLVLGGGTINTVAGTGTAGSGCSSPINPAGTTCKINNPGQSSTDKYGNLYFADTAGNEILEYFGGQLYQVAGTGTSGFSGDGFPAVDLNLTAPSAVVLDSARNIYIADEFAFRIREVYTGIGPNNYPSEMDTIAGSSLPSAAGDPSGITMDSSGHLYFSDVYNNQIKVAYPGVLNGNSPAIAGTGTAGSTGDGGLMGKAQFNAPMGLATDLQGNIYVADSGNNKVRKLNITTGIVTTYAGTGTAGFSGDGGLATQAALNTPVALAMDPYGNLFIADSKNNRVRVVSPAGTITTAAGTGTKGFTGDGGAATAAELNDPEGVAVDASANLYISDRGNQRVREVNNANVIPAPVPVLSLASGTYTGVQTLTITDTSLTATIYYTLDGTVPTTSSAVYTGPIQLTASETVQAIATAPGSLTSAVASATYNLILPLTAPTVFSPAGGTYTFAQTVTITSATAGAVIYYGITTTDTSTAILTTQLTRYTGPITVSNSESIFAYAIAPGFAQSNAVTATYIINNGGPVIITVAGNGVQGWSGQYDFVPLTIPMNQPYATATDSSGNIYYTDTYNNFVKEVNAKTGIVTIVAGFDNGSTLNGPNNGGYNGDSILATSAELNLPTGLAVDSAGNIYISDTGNYRIRKVTASTGKISTIVGTGVSATGTRGGLGTAVPISYVLGLAMDAAGDLFYADRGNNSIWEMPIISNGVYLVAGVYNGGVYPAGYSGDGGTPIAAELNAPTGVAVDSQGNVYIADTGNNRIREITGIGSLNQGENNQFFGVIGTIAGNGTAAFSGDGGYAYLATLNSPTDVRVDGSGNVYISDTNNNRIRQILPSGIIQTLTGNGTATFANDDGAALESTVSGPQGLALDSLGNLYIADTNNQRIREVGYGLPFPVAAPVFNPAPGTYTTVQTLTITDATPGSTIYYCINWTPQNNTWTQYTGPIQLATSEAVYAYATVPNQWQSQVTAGGYNFNFPTAATPVISPAAGTYTTVQSVTITDSTTGAAIYYTTDGTTPNTSSAKYTGAISVGADETITAVAIATGYSLSSRASAQYTINLPTVLYPTFSPAGGVYAAAQTVTITDATPSSTIYYTTNGTAPTTSSTKYTAAVKVSASETLNAIAVASGLQNSGVASATYVIGTKAATINTFAGNGIAGPNGGNGVPANSVQINMANGVATDAAGNVYIADTKNNWIRKVNTAGNIYIIAGNQPAQGGGTAGFTGDGGWASAAEVNQPSGLVVDTAGNIYFADTGNNRVRKIAADGVITTVAGNGTAAFAGDSGQATAASLSAPAAVAFDSAGNLYISDSGNNRIRKVILSSGVISTFAGNGTAAWKGDGAAAASAELNSPQGIAFDSSNNLYIADSANGSVRKVTASTGFISTLAGNGASGPVGSGSTFDLPLGVVVDHAGVIYVTDTGNNYVDTISSTGKVAAFIGNGLHGATGDGGAPLSAEVYSPAQLAVDNSNNLYIADAGNSKIRVVTP